MASNSTVYMHPFQNILFPSHVPSTKVPQHQELRMVSQVLRMSKLQCSDAEENKWSMKQQHRKLIIKFLPASNFAGYIPFDTFTLRDIRGYKYHEIYNITYQHFQKHKESSTTETLKLAV